MDNPILNINLEDAKLLCIFFNEEEGGKPLFRISKDTLEKFNAELNTVFNTEKRRNKILRAIKLEKDKNRIEVEILKKSLL